jgi:spermidine synthase
MSSNPRRIRWSSKNGFIYVNTAGEVFVGGYKQTSARYALLWEDAFKRIDLPRDAASVLMLGLAGGGAVAAIKAAYPKARITAVDYDEEMVSVAKELGVPDDVELVVSDAQAALDSSTQEFDLILVDIFYILTPSPLLTKESFWGSVGRRLTKRGVAVVNVAGNPEYLWLPESLFAHSIDWRYDTNIFGAFWNH